MPPQPAPLGQLSHAQFDDALLASNLEHCAWHTAPVRREPTYTELQFSEFVQARLRSALQDDTVRRELSERHHLPVQDLVREDLSGRRKFMRHFYYELIMQATKRHTRITSREQMLSSIRQDLWNVSAGYIVMDQPSHPLWTMGTSGTSPSGKPVRIMDPTRADRRFAAQLHGSGQKFQPGPDGPVTTLIERALPELLTRHEDCRIIQYCLPLRQRLLELVGGATHLSIETQTECINEIVAAWVDVIPPNDEHTLKQAEEKTGVSRNDAIADIERALVQPYVTAPGGDRVWLATLEERTLLAAADRRQQEYDDLLAVWERALKRSTVPPCTRPSLGLAYLAISAKQKEAADFLGRIRILPDETTAS